MKRNKCHLALPAVAVLLLTLSGGTGAHAASACAGTQLTPGQDVVAAVANAAPATTFCFAPGTYRITGTLAPSDGDTLIGTAGAVIDGAQVRTGWIQAGAVWTLGGQVRTPTYAITGGMSHTPAHPEEVVGDDLYLDGGPLDRVGFQYQGKVVGQAVTTVKPGTYFTNYDTGTITLGSNPTGHLVELAVSQRLLKSTAANVTVTGLTFQHASVLGVAIGGTGAIVSGNEIRYNHLYGIRSTSTLNSQITNNSILGNGILGISGDADKNLIVRGNDVALNDSAHYDMLSGG
jgi:hypothetical protein